MDNRPDHSRETLIWQGEDYKKRKVSLYVPERDHILARHEKEMGNNFTAIYDTIENPDAVYESRDVPNREVHFKMSNIATYAPNYLTKAVVEYYSDNEGYVVTAIPTKKEGGNIGKRTYPEDGLRQDE